MMIASLLYRDITFGNFRNTKKGRAEHPESYSPVCAWAVLHCIRRPKTSLGLFWNLFVTFRLGCSLLAIVKLPPFSIVFPMFWLSQVWRHRGCLILRWLLVRFCPGLWHPLRVCQLSRCLLYPCDLGTTRLIAGCLGPGLQICIVFGGSGMSSVGPLRCSGWI